MKTKEELQKIIADARAELAEMEKPFELPFGDFFITGGLRTVETHLNTVYSNTYHNNGMTRRTREQAENARKSIIRYSKLLALRDALDDGSMQECAIVYMNGKYDYGIGINVAGHAIFFGLESAKKACDLLNSRRFML